MNSCLLSLLWFLADIFFISVGISCITDVAKALELLESQMQMDCISLQNVTDIPLKSGHVGPFADSKRAKAKIPADRGNIWCPDGKTRGRRKGGTKQMSSSFSE